MEFKRFFSIVMVIACCTITATSQQIILPSQNIGTLAPITISFNGASGLEDSWIGLYSVSASDNEYLTYQYIDEAVSGELTFDGRVETGYFNFRMFSGGGYDNIYTGGPFYIRHGALPDISFQNNGLFTFDATANLFNDQAVAVQNAPDQKFVVAGSAQTGEVGQTGHETVKVVLARFTYDGAFDTGFGVNGIVTTNFSQIDLTYVNAMVVQPDGKIIVGGSYLTVGGAYYSTSLIVLIRYNSNGTIDTDFGIDGLVVTNFTWGNEPSGYSSDLLQSIFLQPDGMILVGGYGVLSDGGWSPGFRCNMARYLANGSLDPEFGTDGKLTFFTSGINYPDSYRERIEDIVFHNSAIYAVVTSGDGYFVSNKQFIYKFSMNGTPDNTFGNNGVVVDSRPGLENTQHAVEIAIGPDGYIYTLGSTGSSGHIVLMKKDAATGANVVDFGDDGLVVYNSMPYAVVPGGMEFFADKLYVGHSTYDIHYSVTKFNLDGTVDGSFGTPLHSIVVDEYPLSVGINDMTIQADGKFVLAGWLNFYSSSQYDFTVIRMEENQSGYQEEEQSISLQKGWNGISSFLTPAFVDPELIMAPIGQDFIALQDLALVYYPDGNLNSLDYWNYRNGYMIKVEDETTLPVAGFTPDQTTIMLSEGWNLIPVLSDEPVDIDALLGENIDRVAIIKEAAGLGVFWPAMSINTIPQFLPGKSYLILVSETFTIEFE